MARTNNVMKQPMHASALKKPMLIGAGIALFLISAFLISGGEGDPAWPRFWMIRPLIIVPLAGAVGGACFYFINQRGYKSEWVKFSALIFSFIVFILSLWIGSVLGLVGTYWN